MTEGQFRQICGAIKWTAVALIGLAVMDLIGLMEWIK